MTAMTNAAQNRKRSAGFTLLELMVAIFILTIMLGVVFQQIDMVQRRARTEQSRLDSFQEARDFMDLIVRDIHGAGYPNSRILDSSQMPNGISDKHTAVGLVKVDTGELRLETFDQSGKVVEVVYQLNAGTLSRGQAQKVDGGNPLTGQPVTMSTGIENVLNTNIFTAYLTDGTAVGLPVDINSAPISIASIKSIEIVMQVRGPVADLKTGVFPSTTLRSVVRLINCSQATSAQPNSCS